MVVEECPARLGGRLAAADHILAHAGLADVDVELEQFAVNPRSAPKWVLAIVFASMFPAHAPYRSRRGAGPPEPFFSNRWTCVSTCAAKFGEGARAVAPTIKKLKNEFRICCLRVLVLIDISAAHLEVSGAGIGGHCARSRIVLLYSLISDGTQNCSSNSPVVPNEEKLLGIHRYTFFVNTQGLV